MGGVCVDTRVRGYVRGYVCISMCGMVCAEGKMRRVCAMIGVCVSVNMCELSPSLSEAFGRGVKDALAVLISAIGPTKVLDTRPKCWIPCLAIT